MVEVNWNLNIVGNIPRQDGENDDCGVFTMMIADYLSDGLEPRFDMCDIVHF